MCVESLATSITDLFPRHLRRPCARELLVLVIAVVCFLLGLPLITEVGRRSTVRTEEWIKEDSCVSNCVLYGNVLLCYTCAVSQEIAQENTG